MDTRIAETLKALADGTEADLEGYPENEEEMEHHLVTAPSNFTGRMMHGGLVIEGGE